MIRDRHRGGRSSRAMTRAATTRAARPSGRPWRSHHDLFELSHRVNGGGVDDSRFQMLEHSAQPAAERGEGVGADMLSNARRRSPSSPRCDAAPELFAREVCRGRSGLRLRGAPRRRAVDQATCISPAGPGARRGRIGVLGAASARRGDYPREPASILLVHAAAPTVVAQALLQPGARRAAAPLRGARAIRAAADDDVAVATTSAAWRSTAADRRRPGTMALSERDLRMEVLVAWTSGGRPTSTDEGSDTPSSSGTRPTSRPGRRKSSRTSARATPRRRPAASGSPPGGTPPRGFASPRSSG